MVCWTVSLIFYFLSIRGEAADGKVRISFFNVGYGDAILIQLPDEETVLIDAGPEESSEILFDDLAAAGVKSITRAVLTHPHDNHFGGYPLLLSRFVPQVFYTNGDDLRADPGYAEIIRGLQEKAVAVKTLRRGDIISLQDPQAKLEVLYPESLNDSVNGSALVLLFHYGVVSILLTSDIEPDQQEELINLEPGLNIVNVVQVPHHGGDLSPQFTRFFKSRIYVVSTGMNPYGKPQMKDLARLHGRILRTDERNGVTFLTDGRIVSIVDE